MLRAGAAARAGRRALDVEALGREADLSRSALAERVGEVLSMPPVQYLANWRIHQEPVTGRKSILQIAQEVGYESEASFTRAFKRPMGKPPGTWRRRRD